VKKSTIFDNGHTRVVEVGDPRLMVYAIERPNLPTLPVLLRNSGGWLALVDEVQAQADYLNASGGLRGGSSSTRGRVLAAVALAAPDHEAVAKARRLLREQVSAALETPRTLSVGPTSSDVKPQTPKSKAQG
jgi:hypothetical protein